MLSKFEGMCLAFHLKEFSRADISSRETMDVLREQKNLIESFAAEKSATAKKVEQLSKRIEQAPDSVTNTNPVQPVEKPMQQSSDDFTSFGTSNIQQRKNTGTSTARDISADSTQDFFKVKAVNTTAAQGSIMLQASEPQSSSTDFSTLVEEPALPSAEIADLEHQRKLIEKLLEEVNSSSYAIDHGARYMFHDGVLGLHWQVWAPLRMRHGDDFLRKILSQSPVLARHWHERLLNERRAPMGREFSKSSERIRASIPLDISVPGVPLRPHISPSNKTAEQALQAELLKEEQRDGRIKLERLRAEQDAQEKGNVRSKIEEEKKEFYKRMKELRETDRRMRDEATTQVKEKYTTSRDEGKLTPQFPWGGMSINTPPYHMSSQKLPYDENEAYKAIGKHMEAALKEGKLGAASTDIADTLISQWTTVSPPAVY